jgi:hypothetical protein
MEAILSFETSVLTRATRRKTPEYGILFSEIIYKVHFAINRLLVLHNIIISSYFNLVSDAVHKYRFCLYYISF